MKCSVFLLLSTLLLVSSVSGKNLPKSGKSIYRHLFELKHQDFDSTEEILNRADESPVETQWIEQKVDNFDENNTNKWRQRYMINNNYYQPGGPFFIYVGGESTIRATSITGTRHIVNLAKEHNGTILFPEHRYYGESIPTEDLSTDNLKYLDVRQALADLAYFINTTKTTIPGAENSKVILVGGSYPASMATWFQVLYPDMVVGSWASSGPLLAKADFYEYKEIVGQGMKNVGGRQCYDRIQNGFQQLQNMFEEKRLAEVKAAFKVCNNFNENNQLDVWNFFNIVAEMFSYLVQYAVAGEIETACQTFNGKDEDYISLGKYFLNYFEIETCLDMTYDSIIESLGYTTLEGGASRQWTYQTCNEFGWFQTSTSPNQPFGTLFPLELSLQMCKDLFGDKFTPQFIENQITETNSLFNGYSPAVGNVFFTQGELDPWSAMGIHENIIPMASHCADLRSATVNDSTILKGTRTRVSELVRKWLAADEGM